MPEGPSLAVSGLTASEREQLAKLVDELAASVDAQCPECLQWVTRRTLREHVRECVTSVVRTRRLEVLDDEGAVTAVIGDLGGEHGLALRDGFGADNLVVSRNEEGSAVRFYLGGTEVASFGVDPGDGGEREPGTFLTLSGFRGIPATGWRVTPEGQFIHRLPDDDRSSAEYAARIRPTLDRLIEEEDRAIAERDSGGEPGRG